MKAEPGKPLDDADVERLISAEMTAGLEHVFGADNIAAERDRNYDYYRGIMNDLPAPPGRSRVVENTVANYIGLMKPNLLRIFTAGRNVAEYVSPKPELQPVVRLVTRFINDIVFRKDNRGELLLGDWAEDALVQKLGVAMWWWEEKWEARDEIIQNISAEQMVLVAGDAAARGADIVEHAQDPSGLHAVKVRTRVNKSRCCIDVIPPEEFVVSRDARSLEDAVLKAHRTGVMVGTLIGIGYDADTVAALPTYNDLAPDRTRKYAQDANGRGGRDTSADAMLRKVAVTRGILTCDYDGTGLKAWYFVAGGPEHAPKLLEIAPYNDQLGFADFCPEPLPHTIFGRCPADRLAAIQKVQTVLVRQMNDNLFLSNTPQREVVMDWIVKPDQLMNLAPGAPVLVKQPGAIREISIPFVADKALAAMRYYDGQAELTTGVGRATAGLDPGALANQSATAAANQYSAMLGRIEMIARIWAQGGMRKLFRGVFRCLKAYQDFARIVRIEGQERTVDPRLWRELGDLDVNINTGLGTGTRERDFAMLGAIEAAQKEILEKLGPNPIVDFAKLVRTMQLKAEAAGIAYPENFFADPGAWSGPPPSPPPAPPRPSPDTLVLADVEHAKIAAKARGDAEELAFKRAQAVAKIASDERIAREKTYWETVLAAEKLGIDRSKVMGEAAKVDSAAIAREFPA
ncbi:MAG: hypothetical protein AB7H70_14250 [Rhodospirillaceae bacterium]